MNAMLSIMFGHHDNYVVTKLFSRNYCNNFRVDLNENKRGLGMFVGKVRTITRVLEH